MQGKPRRKFSPEFKSRLVLEVLSGRSSVAALARQYRIKDSLIARWRDQALTCLPQTFAPAPDNPALEARGRTGTTDRATDDRERGAKKSLCLAEPSLALKRQLVNTLSPEPCSVRAACRLCDLAPSSYYYTCSGRLDTAADRRLRQARERLTVLVRRQPAFAHVNHKRVRRVLQEAHLRAKRPRRRFATTDSRHGWRRYPNLVRDLVPTRPDQVWACDLTHIVLSSGAVVFLAIVLDVFTRTIRGWALGKDLTHYVAVAALQQALRHGVCEIHHSDQGVQYATPAYTQLLTARGVRCSMSASGQAWQNGHAERVVRTLKEEEVYLSDYASYDEARAQLGRFIDAV